jgi:signal transduction histidine kinase
MTNGIGGSGLGLHIARGLINAMAGDIWIQPSQPDRRGTTITLQLRLAPEAEDILAAAATLRTG